MKADSPATRNTGHLLCNSECNPNILLLLFRTIVWPVRSHDVIFCVFFLLLEWRMGDSIWTVHFIRHACTYYLCVCVFEHSFTTQIAYFIFVDILWLWSKWLMHSCISMEFSLCGKFTFDGPVTNWYSCSCSCNVYTLQSINSKVILTHHKFCLQNEIDFSQRF